MTGQTILNPQMVEQIRDASRLTDLAYAAIREAIASGRLKPGDWLRQQALAEELGVSQRTVREAFSRLVAEGLVVQVPYKGVKVATLPIDELQDVYETRALLQGYALKLAARRISEGDLARMRELLPRTVVGTAVDSEEAAYEAAREFHMIAILACGRRHLIRALEPFLDLGNPYAFFSIGRGDSRLENAEMELRDHTAILEALEARDGRRARKLIVMHLRRVLRALQRAAKGPSFASQKEG